MELEIGVRKGLGQIGRGVVGQVEGQPGLQCRGRGLGEHVGDLGQRGVLVGDHPVDLGQVGGAHEGPPRKAGRGGVELGEAHGVVGLGVVALFGLGPAGLGDRVFHGQDRLGVGVRVGPADAAQRLGDVVLVLLLLGREGVLQVIVAVRHAEAGLGDMH